MEVSLSQIANLLQTKFQGDDVKISGFSIDSRTVKPGELFIALKGEKFDGHDYIQQAVDQGAAAVLVSSPVTSLPSIQVKDTQKALHDLACAWRAQFDLPVVAITGSCGKTSTRAMVESILSECGPTLASQRSYNNHTGVPLTLLQLRPTHAYAVIEIGANHSGEISALVDIVRPKVSILTLAAASHLAGFGSLEGVARAKAEIFETLGADDCAVINADDRFADYWRGKVDSKVLTFAMQTKADVSCDNLEVREGGRYRFDLKTPAGAIDVNLGLIGKHHVANALAAAAACTAFNIPLQKIKVGLEKTLAENRRLVEQHGPHDSTVIDDSYNANPASVKAAIDVLTARGGVSVLVLGDMAELGQESSKWHREIGQAAKEAGIQHLFCYGDNTRETVEAYGEAGQHFSSREELAEALYPLLNKEVTVLVKGSNSMGMNQVTKRLLQE